MRGYGFGKAAAGFALAVAVAFVAVTPAAGAQAGAVEPAAVQVLKKMTDFLGRLEAFGVHTENVLEDEIDSGQTILIDVSADLVVRRPDKLYAERGGMVDQVFYYDGKTLTLFSPSDGVFATEAAPATIEGMLDFARESLGLIIPAADLIYRNAFDLLMQDVTFAAVVGKALIGGVSCDHLLFSRPGVDFQVWVAEGEQPLPLRYVVSDTATPAKLSVTTVMTDWDISPAADIDFFRFMPPEEAGEIIFLKLE